MALVDAFSAALPAALRSEVDERTGGLLDALVARARSERGVLGVDDETLVKHAAARLAADEPLAQGLARTQAGDLLLACGCLAGHPEAIAAVREMVRAESRAAIGKLRLSGTDPGDVEQRLCERLLVADGDAGARIADYAGRGELRAWIRVIAVREGLQIRRRSVGRTPATLDFDLPDGALGDAELERIKALYRADFKAAFTEAVAELSGRERNLLRQHHLAGLSVDQIGALYGVHRATAARWIVRARTQVAEATTAKLRARLGASEEEMQSIVRLVHSQIDVTWGRVFGEGDDEPG